MSCLDYNTPILLRLQLKPPKGWILLWRPDESSSTEGYAIVMHVRENTIVNDFINKTSINLLCIQSTFSCVMVLVKIL